jgi:hypothetical protein
MSTSEQLEREAEQTRAEIASMLEELRSRMTPGQIVDQMLDFARDSTGGQFFNNLRRQVADNPLPVTLMGAGLAWLVLAGRNGSRRSLASEQRREVSDSYYETESSIGTSVADAASLASSSVAEAANSVAGAANAALEASASRARRAAELIGISGSALRLNTVAASRGIGNFLQEQPLVLAGAGLAIGAALGAMFPATRTENELMGEASDSIKKRAKEVAEEQIEKGKEFAGRVWEDAYAQPADHPEMVGEKMYRSVPEGEYSAGKEDEPRQVAPNASLDGESEPSSR